MAPSGWGPRLLYSAESGAAGAGRREEQQGAQAALGGEAVLWAE